MKISQYLKETKAELEEVTWPTKAQTINFTIWVIIISVIVAAFLGALDFGFKEGVTTIVK